ncbi:MAG: hypothetical protein M1819_001466 [Sarea resinae]|nr:MAG: hypothetical protein M1819_001466 [Sarea resinae]
MAVGSRDDAADDDEQAPYRSTARKTTSFRDDASSDHISPSTRHTDAESFLSDVVEGIVARDRRRLKREVVRYLSFASAILNCLCAGSFTAYSLYGHLFLTRLRYTQLQVNMVSIAAELSMYLPVPIFGYLCDRYSPGVTSFLSSFLFGLGYLLAAFTYHHGPPHPSPTAGADAERGWPFGVMVLAFVGIGMGTSCMYLSAVTTCAKNFGRGKHKGLALALPIASFGLSGMWQSQVGSRLLYETEPDGSRGDVDVFRFFLFLAITLFGVGIIGSAGLRVVDEEEMIDEAVDELERSGLLEESEFFHRAAVQRGYGTLDERRLSQSSSESLLREAEDMKRQEEEDRRKKTWLLNEETRRFLADRTMWWFAAGFFLVTGPGEAFINNLGTILDTLQPPNSAAPPSGTTSAATHVSIVAITSTLARIITGTLSDLLAPTSPTHHYRSLTSSFASLPPPPPQETPSPFRPFSIRRLLTTRPTVSRLTFLLASSMLLSLGLVFLATGLAQNHASRFSVVSALVGAGYGAVFSLSPIVVSVVWGIENFGTNWGVVAMMPALGAAVWGVVYSAVYQWAAAAAAGHDGTPDGDAPGGGNGAGGGGSGAGNAAERMCYGTLCYAPTSWGMAVSVWLACGLYLWAWRGPGGWKRRGIAV